jgi:predicted nuclease of restriction endonuclease-like RecB superfamily
VLQLERDATPAQLRRLLRALKLHQLLFRAADHEGLVRLVIDGPMGLFSSSTRYGMKLALLLRHLQACQSWRLEAQVHLKKGGRAEAFVAAGRGAVDADADAAEPLPPLVQGLLDELPALLPGWLVAPSADLIAVDGHGAIVPDVVVVDAAGRKAYVEVLGFWSRPAVWKRVELAEQKRLPAPVVFCFSERLRVSEEALDDDHASLLSFKGALSAKKVAERLAGLLPTTTTTAATKKQAT